MEDRRLIDPHESGEIIILVNIKTYTPDDGPGRRSGGLKKKDPKIEVPRAREGGPRCLRWDRMGTLP